MMKKYLVLAMVLAISTISSATISLVAPGAVAPLSADDVVRVYLTSDVGGLYTFSATISATNATIVGGITKAAAVNYGAKYTDYIGVAVKAGGWSLDYSFDSIAAGSSVQIGLGAEGSTVYATSLPLLVPPVVGGFGGGAFGVEAYSPLAYIDIKASGTGDIVLSIVNGSQFGSTSIMTDLVTVPAFSSLTIAAVPEPITVALLGLGGLFIRRKVA